MNARPEAWLRQVRDDLALATLARNNGFLAQACYYASQAAEKALKGALLELGIEPPHTHVLNDLLQRLEPPRSVIQRPVMPRIANQSTPISSRPAQRLRSSAGTKGHLTPDCI